MIYRAFWLVIEYQYGSPDSYPAADEAEAKKQAVEYAMKAISEHWYRQSASDTQTRMDARNYPFGGLIRDMRLVPSRRR